MLPTNKALISIVAGLGIILIMGFGALIMGLVIKSNDSTIDVKFPFAGQIGFGASELVKIEIPQGFRIRNVTSNATQIIFHINNDQGEEELFIIENQTGKILGRYIIEIKR